MLIRRAPIIGQSIIGAALMLMHLYLTSNQWRLLNFTVRRVSSLI